MKYFAYNLFPIAALVFTAYCLTIDKNMWALAGFIVSVFSAVVPKTN